MKQYCDENAERFKHLDEDTYDAICKMLNLKNLFGKREAYKNYESGDYNMCKAFDELIKDGERRGEKRGEKRGEERGEKRGEERMGNLMRALLQNGRLEDALNASTDVSLRKKLYQEYSIL